MATLGHVGGETSSRCAHEIHRGGERWASARGEMDWDGSRASPTQKERGGRAMRGQEVEVASMP